MRFFATLGNNYKLVFVHSVSCSILLTLKQEKGSLYKIQNYTQYRICLLRGRL